MDDLFTFPEEEQQQQLEIPEPQPIHFYGMSRGIAKIGLLVSGSTALTILARLFPPVAPVYGIALGVSITLSIGWASLSDDLDQKLAAGIILACLLTGGAIGGWDAIAGLFSDDSGKLFQIQLSVVAAAFCLSAAIVNSFFIPKKVKKEVTPWTAEENFADYWLEE